jgi:hypothetical protein
MCLGLGVLDTPRRLSTFKGELHSHQKSRNDIEMPVYFRRINAMEGVAFVQENRELFGE